MLDQFVIPLDVTIRYCFRHDLQSLEWFGLFREQRELFHAAYERQERGEIMMLVAEVNRFPTGQVWIDLVKKQNEGVGILWALRVLPALQRLGIGTRLVGSAETLLRERGFNFAELGVEQNNSRAQRLYERLGYRVVTSNIEHWHYTTPDGEVRQASANEWIMYKPLNANK